MKVLVCGSRDWMAKPPIATRLALLAAEEGKMTLLHGGAKGADRLARNVGCELGFEVIGFPAQWQLHGKRAGIVRNNEMLDEKPDLVIAFQLNGSRGTQYTIDEARRRGIPVEVHSRDTDMLNGESG